MTRQRAATTFLVVCLLVSLALVGRILWPFLTPIVWAAAFATSCHPLFRRLCVWFRGRRNAVALVACILISALLVIPLLWLTLLLARQSVEAYESLRRLVESPEFQASIRRPTGPFARALEAVGGLDQIRLESVPLTLLRNASSVLVSSSASIVSGFANFVLEFSLMILAMYVFFLDGDRMVSAARALIPMSRRHSGMILRQFREVSTATIYGGLATAVAQGVTASLVFLALGLPSPIVWGAATAAASFIPVVGATLIWGPAAVYLLATGSVAKGVALTAAGVCIIGTIDNIVKPLLMGGAMKMHTLLLFFGILGGLQAFGFIGLVLGPLIIAIAQTFMEIARQERSGEPVERSARA